MSGAWMRGPYGGEGWRIEDGRFETESGLVPMIGPEVLLLRDRAAKLRGEIIPAAEGEGCPPRILAAIGWSETRLQNLPANQVGAGGRYGMLASTASWLAGRTVTVGDLVDDPALAARLSAKLLVMQGRQVGYPISDPINLPIVASCYNAGCGKGKVRESQKTPYRMVYDLGQDGGYLPRVMRAWNELDGYGEAGGSAWLKVALGVAGGIAGGLLLGVFLASLGDR